MGRRLADFLPAAAAALLRDAYLAAWSGEECQVEFASDDGAIHCLASFRPRSEAGEVREVILSGVEVSELKKTQAEAQKLALVASRTDNAVILTDAEGRIEWINEGFTRITGYEFAEVRGRKPGSFLQGPESSPGTVRLMREHISRGEGFAAEIVNYAKGGRKYWLAIEVRPIHDAAGRLTHYMAIESDITARRQADESLLVQFRLSQALAGRASPGEVPGLILASIGREIGWRFGILWVVTPDRDALVYADHWASDGCSAPALVDYCRALRLERGVSLPGQAWANASVEWCEDLGEIPDSTCAELALREGMRGAFAIPIRAGGDVLGVVEFLSARVEPPDEARFLTCAALGAQIGQFYERMHAEDASRRRGEELLQANIELARASSHKNAFLASMSHELRTPLNSILGLSESLADRLHGPLTDKQARYLGLVIESGRHLLSLINDILDLARIESGQQAVERVEMPLAEICREAVQIVAPMAQRRNQRLEVELPPEDVRLFGDPRRIKQILVNLLGNAVKFTPPGGALGLRVRMSLEDVRLAVWDRGIGISDEDLPRLFRPFQQLDSRLSRDYPGTGLGLSLVKQLVVLHDGRVEVESRVDQGSTFTVVLPASRLALAAKSSPSTSAGMDARVPDAPAEGSPRVLIVDDIPINITALRDYLEIAGYRVAVANDGRQAVALTRELRPALILMDIQMPNLDGLGATRAIRAMDDPGLASTPIIAVTALAMDRDREICFAAGVDDYVAKPYSLRDLHACIRTLLAKKRA